MVMELKDLLMWLGVAGTLLGIANTAWIMFGRAAKPLTDKIAEYRKDLVDHDRRIQAVESELRHLPSRLDVSKLEITTTRLEGDLKTLNDQLGTLNHTVRRIDDYLRKAGSA